MKDHELVTRDVGPTFVNAKHEEVSTLGFIVTEYMYIQSHLTLH